MLAISHEFVQLHAVSLRLVQIRKKHSDSLRFASQTFTQIHSDSLRFAQIRSVSLRFAQTQPDSLRFTHICSDKLQLANSEGKREMKYPQDQKGKENGAGHPFYP